MLTRHQVYLERLKAGELRAFDPVLAKLIAVVVQRLKAAGDVWADIPRARLDQIIRQTLGEGEQVLLSWQDDLGRRLEEAAGYEAEFTSRAVEHATEGEHVKAVSKQQAWTAAQERPIHSTGELLQPFVKDWSASLLDSVESTMRIAHAQGWTVQDTVRKVRGTKATGYADGLAAGMRRSVEALVRTAMQHVSNAAREATLEANADIVKGVRWISTLDSRTCQRCAPLDQQVFDINHGPRPPLHPSCRCTLVAEMAETVHLVGEGTRASKGAFGGEPVSAKLTYYSWLKTQPASFQDTAIGPTRAKLLRNGGLSAEEFARLNLDKNFEPLTLEELKKLAPEAFKRAGITL